MQEALTAYTSANAGFQQNQPGSASGYLADLAALDTDLTRCAPEQIHQGKLLRKLISGEVRFGPAAN